MDCPKCDFALEPDAVECPRCGIVIAKFLRARERASSGIPQASANAQAVAGFSENDDARAERQVRALALPLALIGAWLAVKAAPGAVRMLTMWVHESGHAVTAWVCGFAAFPGPWFTPVSDERSPLLSVMLAGLLSYGGYRAWQLQRRFWIAASASGIALTFCGTLLLTPLAARQLIIFGGDGGCLVLGTLLMLTVYAREQNPVRHNHLRWGFLVIGAFAVMDVFAVWTGPIDRLPLGENENGLSDPSVLTEQYGWNLLTLIHRYDQLAYTCFALLLVVYLTNLTWPSDRERQSTLRN